MYLYFILLYKDYNLKLLEIFRRFDLNHNHKINHAELRNLMMAAGWRDDGELVDRLVKIYLYFIKFYA